MEKIGVAIKIAHRVRISHVYSFLDWLVGCAAPRRVVAYGPSVLVYQLLVDLLIFIFFFFLLQVQSRSRLISIKTDRLFDKTPSEARLD